MSTSPLFLGLEEIREMWGWFLALGITLIILGVIALFMIPYATIAGVLVLAWLKFEHWRWAVFDGVITLALGILLWAQWPVAGLWFLGLALGVSLVLRGWSYIMVAMAVKQLPRVLRPIRSAA